MLEVNPIADELFPSCTFALCNLVFMMWKYEIDSARVNLKRLTQILHRHRRALDMPARTAATNRCVPCGFGFRCGLFPKRKVARVFFFVFVRIDSFTSAGDISS